MGDKDLANLIKEMEAVKKLLILQLLARGVRQKDIALMLDISEAKMSRMLPKGMNNLNTKSGS